MIFPEISSSSVGMESISVRTMAQASVYQVDGLIRQKAVEIYRLKGSRRRSGASDPGFTRGTPRSALQPSSNGNGIRHSRASSTSTGWKRRSRAGSLFNILPVFV